MAYASPVRDLGPLFDPRSLAVLGASNDPAKWGQWISAGALRGADRRDVWLVNRNGGEILGQQAYRSLAELPGSARARRDRGAGRGVRGRPWTTRWLPARAAIVAITAGLGEVDEGGKELERRVVEKVRAGGSGDARPELPRRLRRSRRRSISA